MTIAQEEIFGPVLVLIPFEDDDDAVRIANDSAVRPVRRGDLGVRGAGPGRGLAGSGPARSRSTAASTTAPTSPFGGYKASGIGRQNGIEGFEQYLETKTIAVGK